ncbi:hypothetical protein [Roseinatronobacter alkalisoli]|uniref:Uncharacterized protein n=1 Tax=Roseinatronobacter alkalisoli TaxID=3028235 RepID=A0ABT5T8P0_9RHOB|nr:hypothetical protein [Roseinatronobacter sp. HJB301]MDD7970293.1 hypothetical protein [Roseinatronobacter sp. HJB301]
MRLFVSAAALALAASGFVAPLHAQGMACAPRADMLNMLADKTQTRRAIGLSGRAVMEMFAATDSTDWTVTVTLPDGRMCLLAQGTAFDAGYEMFPARKTML